MYQIQYVDNSFRMVEWSDIEFMGVCKLMEDGKRMGYTPEGLFVLTDIRAIVLVPKPESEPEEEDQLSEYGHYDPDTIAWLRANGVDISKGGK